MNCYVRITYLYNLQVKAMHDISVTHLKTVDSTNTYAKSNISLLTLPALVTAETQTAGRGRQGKSFFSPNGTGLYMTLVFEAPNDCSLLTPAAAVAVCDALKNFGLNPKIKWVNDIFINGYKVCGILTECFTNDNKTYIALGIGINLTTTNFPDELTMAGSAEIMCDKTDLALEISNTILDYVKIPDTEKILKEYEKRLLVLGKEITYFKNNIEYSATVKGINSVCNLIVEKKDGTEDILSSGEISIKI